MTDQPRRRGRPPKEAPPPQPKEPKKTGPKSVWAECLGKTSKKTIVAPEKFFDLWLKKPESGSEFSEFKKRVNELLLEFHEV